MSVFDSAPVYVTRKSADGYTGQYSQTIWMSLLVQLLAWGNGVLWGVYGIIQAIQHIF